MCWLSLRIIANTKDWANYKKNLHVLFQLGLRTFVCGSYYLEIELKDTFRTSFNLLFKTTTIYFCLRLDLRPRSPSPLHHPSPFHPSRLGFQPAPSYNTPILPPPPTNSTASLPPPLPKLFPSQLTAHCA